jgi:hypothetical protein
MPLRRPRTAGSSLAVTVLAALLVLAVQALAPSPLAAQRTRDQARLVFTVMPGYVLGNDLWRVRSQPVENFIGVADTFDISRDIQPTLGVVFSGAYFKGAHFGITGEAFLLGLGFADTCSHTYATGDSRNAAFCSNLNGREKAASAVVLNAGAIYRINSQRVISPYLRANAGVVVSNQSSIRTIATDERELPPVDLVIFDDPKSTRFSPAIGLGLGFTASLGPGYALRWEVRDNIAGVQRLEGRTTGGGVPEHKMALRHLPSMMIGLDVVLERRAGRRY